ncbi:MAG: hypothetical protein JSR27_09745 [Proteobacteria bacterium]|nr:hypothetical protein [Pseudomonadota bacterium]
MDDHLIHIQSESDVQSLRQNLYQFIWGQDSLPSDANVTVTPGVDNPAWCSTDVDHVDELTISMPVSGLVELCDPTTDDCSTSSTVLGAAWHFVPTNPRHRLVIVENGHLDADQMDGPGEGDSGYGYSGACDSSWLGDESDFTYYGMQTTINALLADGFDVLAVAMPLYVPGQCAGYLHASLFDPEAAPADGGSAVRYFLDTTLRSLNYLLATQAYSDVSMLGLSGGGWTTTLYAALDPRITKSFPVAGSLPLYLRNANPVPASQLSTAVNPSWIQALSPQVAYQCPDLGDEEQWYSALYSIAGYPDLYVLGGYGPGREQVQILNRNDSCCYGQDQHGDPDDYDSDLRGYESAVRRVLHDVGAGAFTLQIDESSTLHQISRDAIHDVILANLDGAHPAVGAATGSEVFARGYNGHLWMYGSAGWQDLGYRINGKPAVLADAVYPMQIAVRDAVNEPEIIYYDGTRWQASSLPSGELPDLPDGEGKIIADPVLASAAQGSFDVFAQGTDMQVYHWHVTAAQTTFEQVSNATCGQSGTPQYSYACAVGTPAVAANAAGGLSVFYRSANPLPLDMPDFVYCSEAPRAPYALVQNADATWQTVTVTLTDPYGGNATPYTQTDQRIAGATTTTFPSTGFIAGMQRSLVLDADNTVSEFASPDGGPTNGQWTVLTSNGVRFAGSPGSPVAAAGGETFYVRTSTGDLGQFVYDTASSSWDYAQALDLGSGGAAQSMLDSPLDTPDGVYWTGQDGQTRFYDGSSLSTLNAVDTIFRDDFEGVLSP